MTNFLLSRNAKPKPWLTSEPGLCSRFVGRRSHRPHLSPLCHVPEAADMLGTVTRRRKISCAFSNFTNLTSSSNYKPSRSQPPYLPIPPSENFTSMMLARQFATGPHHMRQPRLFIRNGRHSRRSRHVAPQSPRASLPIATARRPSHADLGKCIASYGDSSHRGSPAFPNRENHDVVVPSGCSAHHNSSNV